MQHIKEYIKENQNFLVNKKLNSRQKEYEYFPETTEELQEIIIELLQQGETNLNCIDTSKITKMDWLFNTINDGIKIKDINISDWDVSNVQDMNCMFYKCENFNSDLSKWNVSNVKNMSYMFNNCSEFNSDLSNWDVSKVKWMNSMFYNCNEFNSDLSNWDVSNVIDMGYMFDKCSKLEKNNLIPKWYTGEV